MRFARNLLLLALAMYAPSTLAQGDLGSVDFPNSGASAAQADFVRGVLLLHSFEYEDSRTAFLRAQETDPSFTLAYWGEAMTFNHPLWFQQDRDSGRGALRKLGATLAERRGHAQTEREAMYLDAIEQLYGEGEKAERDHAYLEAMHRLQRAYPDDQEAKAFYALAILGSVPARDFATYMRAAAVAEEVFARNPRHPGAVHYLIHSYDDPIHAPLGVRAADRYAEIAPAASHAQHMISHIWTALGDWGRVVVANAAAVRVSEQRLERMGRSLAGRSKHALLWEEYGLLQQGRFNEAMQLLRTMRSDAAEAPDRGNLWHQSKMRAVYVIEAPTHADIPADIDTGDLGLGAYSTDAFADAFRALALDDPDAAREARDRLRARLDEARVTSAEEGRNAYDGATTDDDLVVADIKLRQIDAMLAFRSGERERAIDMVRAAATDEAARALEYGPPTIEKPSHELLGEMLYLAGRHSEAIEVYTESLRRAPRRTLSLAGLALAASAAGDTDASNRAWADLLSSYRADEATVRRAHMPWLTSAGETSDEE